MLNFKAIAMKESSPFPTQDNPAAEAPNESKQVATEPQPSYTKLAMRNMVRKGGTSLKHFLLTALGLLSVLVGLAYLTR